MTSLYILESPLEPVAPDPYSPGIVLPSLDTTYTTYGQGDYDPLNLLSGMYDVSTGDELPIYTLDNEIDYIGLWDRNFYFTGDTELILDLQSNNSLARHWTGIKSSTFNFEYGNNSITVSVRTPNANGASRTQGISFSALKFGGGQDSLDIFLEGGITSGDNRDIGLLGSSVDLGDGNNHVSIVNFSGQFGIGLAGSSIRTGSGEDAVDLVESSIAGDVLISLGSGNDRFAMVGGNVITTYYGDYGEEYTGQAVIDLGSGDDEAALGLIPYLADYQERPWRYNSVSDWYFGDGDDYMIVDGINEYVLLQDLSPIEGSTRFSLSWQYGTYHLHDLERLSINGEEIVLSGYKVDLGTGFLTQISSSRFVEGTELLAGSVENDPDGFTAIYGYQWYKNGELIGGATQQSLYVDAVGHGDYSVSVTYEDGKGFVSTLESSAVTVQKINNGFGEITSITQANNTLYAGSLSGDVDGGVDTSSQDVVYQWFKNGDILTGENNESLSLGGESAGSYSVSATYLDNQGFSNTVTSGERDIITGVMSGPKNFSLNGKGGTQLTIYGHIGLNVEDILLDHLRFGNDQAGYIGELTKKNGRTFGKFNDVDYDGFVDYQTKISTEELSVLISANDDPLFAVGSVWSQETGQSTDFVIAFDTTY